MTLWLEAARIAAGANAVLLLALGWVWLGNYRRHGARHTLGYLVFAAFLLVENALWLYFYLLHPDFIGWFRAAGTDVQVGVTLLCALELVALAFIANLTLR
ncbi:hypothetical protein [Haloarchaeobius amylolyticus]|uniref:hypothetical protein n=1 Tax=Haloarchaeobius amylolyticus TaxID=1198296 RepID=UPI002270145A|nr:hypothetical protein [Haloarchaeobius amylolyticus]